MVIIISGIFILWGFYQFEFGPLITGIPGQKIKETYDFIDRTITEESLKTKLINFIEKVPIPLPTYIYGTLNNYVHSKVGHMSFFMGDNSPKGWWNYYLIGFLIKTPIPTIIFLLLTLLFYSQIRHKETFNEILLILPIFVLMFVLSINSVNTGTRHMLPIYPLLFIFISKIVNIGSKIKKNKRIILNVFFASMFLWYVISSIMIYPNYLAYFNDFIGGSGNGYKYMTDASLDWGQDIKGLASYLEINNINHIKANLFSEEETIKYYGINYTLIPPRCDTTYMFKDSDEVRKPEDCQKTKGLIAISATNLQNTYNYNHTCFDWLEEYEPIEKIGYSIFIYNITNLY